MQKIPMSSVVIDYGHSECGLTKTPVKSSLLTLNSLTNPILIKGKCGAAK